MASKLVKSKHYEDVGELRDVVAKRRRRRRRRRRFTKNINTTLSAWNKFMAKKIVGDRTEVQVQEDLQHASHIAARLRSLLSLPHGQGQPKRPLTDLVQRNLDDITDFVHEQSEILHIEWPHKSDASRGDAVRPLRTAMDSPQRVYKNLPSTQEKPGLLTPHDTSKMVSSLDKFKHNLLSRKEANGLPATRGIGKMVSGLDKVKHILENGNGSSIPSFTRPIRRVTDPAISLITQDVPIKQSQNHAYNFDFESAGRAIDRKGRVKNCNQATGLVTLPAFQGCNIGLQGPPDASSEPVNTVPTVCKKSKKKRSRRSKNDGTTNPGSLNNLNAVDIERAMSNIDAFR